MMEEKKDMFKDQETAVAVSPVKAVPDSIDTEDDEDESAIIKFKKPYKFEGKEYTEIDLSPLENITGADMIRTSKRLNRTNPGINVLPEITLEYALNIAADILQFPIEFFTGLPGRYAMAVKNRVSSFIFGAE